MPKQWQRACLDVVAVAAAWIAIVLFEPMAILLLWNQDFSGAWEMAQVRRVVAPIAIAGLVCAAPVAAALWQGARRAHEGSRTARGALGFVGALSFGGLALGVSTGRHFASVPLRWTFIVILAALGGFIASRIAARLAALEARPATLASVGLAAAIVGWLGDAFVLPRLYPAFHVALLVTLLLGAGLAGIAVRASVGGSTRAHGVFVVGVVLIVAVCAVLTPREVRALGRMSNLRVLLVEHAPILGRAVELSQKLSPDEYSRSETPSASVDRGEIARSLDWTGRDIVLVSVDALRADHVSAYGYARPTTPNIDALARQGTLFEAAYCPTPHTSYSVTSMMTGKYLRPLLALGLGDDSETWAQDLRRYGWRTAAFYPPAVFFIDEARFPRFEQTHLGFEYAKIEFADPVLREKQVADYLKSASGDMPLFLWVHFFEPHEPYVAHPEHVFSGSKADVDLYDGEIATADDGIGRIVRLIQARRPGAVVIVTADHGEEFGDHGGHYHGTTVYEEQVRVPLVVAGPGVRSGARVATVVQTIDLLPTTLSALGIPRPVRLRGRDLGPVLRGEAPALDAGFAFAETDDYALVAEGPDRLVCGRRAAACALYRPSDGDPGEHRDIAAGASARFDALRATLRSIERQHGQFESGAASEWPEALRRGMQGDIEAAPDVVALLDDANAGVRRKAAEVAYALHAPATEPELRRALSKDEDEDVRTWAALALARIPTAALSSVAEAQLKNPNKDWRRRAALALGERGDAKACDEIAAWWGDVLPPAGQGSAEGEPPRLVMDLPSVRELLGATSRAHCKAAVPALLQALVDVRARPAVADTLGALADDRARAPLRALLALEPYVTSRPHEAQALVALGGVDWAAPPGPAPAEAHATVKAPRGGPPHLVVLLTDPSAELDVVQNGGPPMRLAAGEVVRTLDLPAVQGPAAAFPVRLDLRASAGGVAGLWLDSLGRLD